MCRMYRMEHHAHENVKARRERNPFVYASKSL
jgi:hypothetical protein